MTNLSVRSLVAVVAIPIILGCAYAGGYPFFGLLALVTVIGLREFFVLSRSKGAHPQTTLASIFAILLLGVFLHGRMHAVLLWLSSLFDTVIPLPSMAQAFLIVVLLCIPVLFFSELFRNVPNPFSNIAFSLLGILYLSVCFGSLVGIREIFIPTEFPVTRHFGIQSLATPSGVVQTIDSWGGLTVCCVFASVWVCDSAAYFAGRGFGRHKL